jgi:hypothetical protein
MSLHLFAPYFNEELTGKNGPVYEKQPIIGKQDAHPGCTALNRGYVDKDPSVRVSELSMDGSVWDFFSICARLSASTTHSTRSNVLKR